jgi:hypothetical protein
MALIVAFTLAQKKSGDAKPIFLPSPARDLATEHISTRNDLTSLPASPYTCEHAALVPQIDRMGKADAYRSLQLTPCGPLMHEGAHFKWWLFICNLGKNTRETIGCGIVAATLENKWEHGVQLLLTRSDNTEAKLQLLQQSHGRYITRLLLDQNASEIASPIAVIATATEHDCLGLD